MAETEFDKQAAELNLTPEQYVGSIQLRRWSISHMNDRYVPESLLKAWKCFLNEDTDTWHIQKEGL